METKDDINKKCVKEIVRQLCHPITGISKNLLPVPVTVNDWNKCLSLLYGWINIGINEITATAFHELRIGEVVPSISANMDIYSKCFATSEIARILEFKDKNKNYIAIINYYSFLKLINNLLQSQTDEYKIKFNDSFKLIFKNINPKTFWINILVNEKIANCFKTIKIGEIIVKEGVDNNFHYIKKDTRIKDKNLPAVWDPNSDENHTEENNDTDNITTCKDTDNITTCNDTDNITTCNDTDNITMSDEDEYNESDEGDNESDEGNKNENMDNSTSYDNMCDSTNNDNENEDPSVNNSKNNKIDDKVDKSNNDTKISDINYRLIMNNQTFLKLINSLVNKKNSIHTYLNLFQLIGGDSEDFSDIFGKLQI